MENKQNTGSKTKQTFPLPPKKVKNRGWKKWVKFVWIALVVVILGISSTFFAVSQGFLGNMPDVKELENPDIYVASEIYSSDGKMLGKFEKEKTQPITYKELPPYLIYALQAKEDERFQDPSGVDVE